VHWDESQHMYCNNINMMNMFGCHVAENNVAPCPHHHCGCVVLVWHYCLPALSPIVVPLYLLLAIAEIDVVVP
jgi:hypothetical protein